MRALLNQHDIVNVFCNARGISLSSDDRQALANIIFEIATNSYEKGIQEMMPYKRKLREVDVAAFDMANMTIARELNDD